MATKTLDHSRWFVIKLKPGWKEKNAPCYASKSPCDGYVRLSNGAYVNFVLTVEECQERYEITVPLSDERSLVVDKRYDWEQGR